jgi:putative peptidoglycan lipid II flippase
LQNVFGEGALSASFIPVYAKLLAQDDEKEAGRVANAVFGILALVTAVTVLIGVLTTPYIVTAIAAGFEAERRELAITLVRIFFPGAGLLVLSAWCLGVLNSHHRFFISYTAPVAWNAAIIAALIYFGNRVDLATLAAYTAWASVAGSALQFGVQLPTVLRLLDRVRPELAIANAHVRQVLHSFFPVFMSRGVVQISAFVDAFLASFLGQGAMVALNYAQSLYTLPVSLFGMSVSAAELPAMSKALGTESVVAETLRHRLDEGLKRISFFIVPSAVAFLALGDVIAAVLYQTGKFTRDDSLYVWTILAGSAVGLLASTQGRLYSSTYYALRDTRTPLRYAVLRVAFGGVLGYFCSLHLPRLLGIDPLLGAAGLTVASGLAGWIEYILLRRSLNRRIGTTGLPFSYTAKLWTGALIGAGLAWAIKLVVGGWHPIPLAIVVLGLYGSCYFAVGYLFGLPPARAILGRFLRFVPGLR